MKTFRCLVTLLLAVGISLIQVRHHSTAHSAQKENHCFTCHTDARKLIKITREIEETRAAEPEAEIKTEGEG